MGDLISRQAAIDEANAWLLDCLKVQKQNRSCGLIRRLEDLPSADGFSDGYRQAQMDAIKAFQVNYPDDSQLSEHDAEAIVAMLTPYERRQK